MWQPIDKCSPCDIESMDSSLPWPASSIGTLSKSQLLSTITDTCTWSLDSRTSKYTVVLENKQKAIDQCSQITCRHDCFVIQQPLTFYRNYISFNGSRDF